MKLPYTDQRVAQNTSALINQKIKSDIGYSIAFYKENPYLISERLKKLDEEWDIERILETNAATIITASSLLGFSTNKKFFVIPFIVGVFLLQHALQGWCPPLPILRRLGYRTSSEIQEERSALESILSRRH